MGEDLQAEFVALGPDAASSDARFEPPLDHGDHRFDLGSIAVSLLIESRLHQPAIVTAGRLGGGPAVLGRNDRSQTVLAAREDVIGL